MIDVWSAVRWWDEWQLRILVLSSLGLQWFMLVAAPMRKYTIPQFLRTMIWLAYISSDALAIYALATLFNRHAKASNGVTCSGNGGKAGVLEILWAPVLLMHLGGQREVTAYTIEDNELWMRHTMTLVSQVAVALYAFYKSWPDSTDTRLWATAVVLFVVGVLSFCEKPWAFYRARIHKLEVVSRLIQGTSPSEKKWCFCFNELDEEEYLHKISTIVRCRFCLPVSNDQAERRASKELVPKKGKDIYSTEQKQVWSLRNKVHMILSDLSLYAAASDWIRRQQLQGKDDPEEENSVKYNEILGSAFRAERFAKRWLIKAFGLIYTRYNVVWTPAYLAYHLLLVPALHATAIMLFAVSHKRGVYNPADVKTTYILLSFTAALDFFGTFSAELLHWLMNALNVSSLCEWIAQYNLIDAALRMRRPIIGGLIKGQLERYFLRTRNNLFNKVAGYLIIDLLKQDNIVGLDFSTYRNLKPKAFNWALSQDLRDKACGEGTEVRRSLLASFDKSVLIWHIATDLCFCLKPPLNPRSSRAERTEAISNYMSYLLYFHPDMLLTGSRRHLFAEAMDNIQGILREEVLPVGRHFKQHPNDKVLAECIFRHTFDRPVKLSPTTRTMMKTKGPREGEAGDHNHSRPLDHESGGDHSRRVDHKSGGDHSRPVDHESGGDHSRPVDHESGGDHSGSIKYPLIHDACRLAEELLMLSDETRFELMYHVWLGMLCYSATMCRGYLHAKSLGEGGEFLSFVWLLLSTKGSKTLADKLQMPPGKDDNHQPAKQDKRYRPFKIWDDETELV